MDDLTYFYALAAISSAILSPYGLIRDVSNSMTIFLIIDDL